MAVGASAAVRAKLTREDTQEFIEFHYNPETLSITKAATWAPSNVVTGETQIAPPQFRSSSPQTMSFTMYLDQWKGAGASGANSPGNVISKLISWARPTDQSVANNTPQPPLVSFSWGVQQIVATTRWYVQNLRINLMMFSTTGDVTRAKVEITLQEYTAPEGTTNPTSGGPSGRRARVLGDGDTLQSIAHHEYGSPGLWRALAEVNRIEDPLRLAPGMTILIPPPAEAERLS